MGDLIRPNIEILIVDDEPNEKQQVKNILLDEGYMVAWCRNWNETEDLILDRVSSSRSLPKVVLVDMTFFGDHCTIGTNPDLEGLLIIKKLIKKCRIKGIDCPPVIGFTSRNRVTETVDILKAGAMDFITKEEYTRPAYFSKRLTQAILMADFKKSQLPLSKINREEVEEEIFLKVLNKTANKVDKAAELLSWPIDDANTVYDRILKRRSM